MPTASPPPTQRFIPTLTEVVETPPQALAPVLSPAAPAGTPSASPAAAPLNAAALTDDILKRVRPILEQDLRDSAQDLFQVQIVTIMPALQVHIEEAVRKAVSQVLGENRPAIK